MTGGPAIVGLTGGIGSGKSTVAAEMRRLGAHVIDADQVARELVAPGEPALADIERLFGSRFLRPDGTLDRPALGRAVFGSPESLARLEAIVHPALRDRIARQVAALDPKSARWIVLEAALLLEKDLAPPLDELVVVVCDPQEQIRRVMARDGLDRAQALARLASQTDNLTRRARAGVVVENDGTFETLLGRTQKLVRALEERFGHAGPS
jgi:dephospho-CoA kinase